MGMQMPRGNMQVCFLHQISTVAITDTQSRGETKSAHIGGHCHLYLSVSFSNNANCSSRPDRNGIRLCQRAVLRQQQKAGLEEGKRGLAWMSLCRCACLFPRRLCCQLQTTPIFSEIPVHNWEKSSNILLPIMMEALINWDKHSKWLPHNSNQ